MSFAKTYLAEIVPTLDDADRREVADAAPVLVAVVADLSVDPARVRAPRHRGRTRGGAHESAPHRDDRRRALEAHDVPRPRSGSSTTSTVGGRWEPRSARRARGRVVAACGAIRHYEAMTWISDMTTRIADATGHRSRRARRSTPTTPTRCCGSPGSPRTRAANARTRRSCATCSGGPSRSGAARRAGANVGRRNRPECASIADALDRRRGRRGRGRRRTSTSCGAARNGELGSAPRSCPHLDHDLAEGFVVDDELVCPGHGWAFDGRGHTYKRNEFGRVDPKGTRRRVDSCDEDADGSRGRRRRPRDRLGPESFTTVGRSW